MQRRPSVVLVLVLAAASPALAADESVLLERPPPKSVVEESGALERGVEDEPAPEPARYEQFERPFEDLPAFFRDTQLEVDFRTYYLRRRLTTGRKNEALAIGGTVRYRSGLLFEHAQLGGAFFTSQKLHGPDDRDGTGLLRSRQRSYTALGETFLRLKGWNHEITAWRQPLGLPYLNGNDGRMTPNTFEGFTLFGRLERVSYTAGHLLQFKRRNDDGFESFSEAAGVPGASSGGLTFAGVIFEPIDGLSLGAINHYVKDTLNTAYTELEWVREVEDGWAFRLGSQFTHQRSVGDDLLTGESFETWVWDAKVATSWRELLVSVAVSVTDDEAHIRNPWGSYPGYLSMMFRSFNRADEKAWGIGASGYLGGIGLPDLSLALRYAEGYDGKDPSGRKVGDEREFNATLDYRLSRRLLRGLWLRSRFGWGQTENERRDTLEVRLVLRYELQLL